MSRNGHTPEPWRVSGTGFVVAYDEVIGNDITLANAQRIVACVNALQGVSLEAIENGGRSGSVMQALGLERDRLKTLLDATQEQYRKDHLELSALRASMALPWWCEICHSSCLASETYYSPLTMSYHHVKCDREVRRKQLSP